ncbi:chaperone modulator CbpM [Epilithonimonas sp. JDS]|uniref:chaperone modulator CbpM n=1 Tax=Epilithonimonas sp. JDS TaxID=2902797 RepID=UPI001E49D7D8|nr:chaperone modulator CbpM [Epilithonimonas sp. JDS]MCD9853548.1 chaperone modulator CbpM [Epilithonimonas sp. JDS]
MSERISIKEVIQIYKIDDQFLNELIASELLHPETENSIQYIIYEELPHLERFTNWHYDLEINLPGIEIIYKLLNQMEELRIENKRLSKMSQDFTNWEDAEF